MRISLNEHGHLDLPDSLLTNIRMVHGAQVDRWLAQLGPMLSDILSSMDAHLLSGNPSLSYHLVIFAERATGEDIAIKCTVPNPEQRPEVAGVSFLSDAGIGPRLCLADLDRGVLVLERVQPGTIMPTAMPSLADDALTSREVATLASRMARVVMLDDRRDDLVPVHTYSRALDDIDQRSSLWPDHRSDVQQAIDLRNTLLAAPDRRDVFLHGDLHHYNILQDQARGLSVIDPKGLTGPAGYDFGAYTYNPMGIQQHPEFAGITRQRVDIWSEVTGIPWETVRSWGYVAAMLSACWSAEDGGDGWQGSMEVARTLRDL